MADSRDAVVAPEVEADLTRGDAGGPVHVMITPQEAVSADALVEQLAASGIAASAGAARTCVSATLTPDSLRRVAALESVRSIWIDHELRRRTEGALRTIRAQPLAAGAPDPETCEDVTWAVLDNGIDASHPALRGCSVDTRNLTDEGPSGRHGTHIAGIIGGYGPDQGFVGVAPRCHLLNYKVLGRTPATVRVVIAALEDIRRINDEAGRIVVHGANVSLGYLNEENFKVFPPGHSPLCEAVDRLVESGVFVAVAAGDFGAQAYLTDDSRLVPVHAFATIADPGTAELPVTVGSAHSQDPERYGVSVFSSKGPTGDGRPKPDLVAPGEEIWSCVPGGQYLEQSGTSQATAFVSGAAAFLLHRFPDLVGRPAAVKDLLIRSARDLHRDRNFQGHGLVDLAAALRLAGDDAARSA